MNDLNEESVVRALISQTDGLGPRNVKNLIESFDNNLVQLFRNPERVKEVDVDGFGEKRSDQLKENLQNWDIQAAAERLKEKGIGVISAADPEYTDSLYNIYDPPPALFYRGELDTLSDTKLAIVGTRKASELGKNFAQRLAKKLATIGVKIISGLAYGIDAAAHRGALNGESNSTAAILGTGVDIAYPKRNQKLHEEIEKSGLLLSEYPPGTEPDGRHFPERNRIISGLSSAVLVVQAGVRSGAIITADCALEQGREVYAVPGSINNDLHKGCHRLIKEGAGLVESPEDVIDYLQVDGNYQPPGQTVTVEPEAKEILTTIKSRPLHLDEICEKTGLDHGVCSKHLLQLENEGLILALPGQRYQRSSQTDALEIKIEAD